MQKQQAKLLEVLIMIRRAKIQKLLALLGKIHQMPAHQKILIALFRSMAIKAMINNNAPVTPIPPPFAKMRPNELVALIEYYLDKMQMQFPMKSPGNTPQCRSQTP
jgi:hypothetical protein